MNVWLHKRWGIVVEQLAASQEGLSSMELVVLVSRELGVLGSYYGHARKVPGSETYMVTYLQYP
jgi:hypothetical protein